MKIYFNDHVQEITSVKQFEKYYNRIKENERLINVLNRYSSSGRNRAILYFDEFYSRYILSSAQNKIKNIDDLQLKFDENVNRESGPIATSIGFPGSFIFETVLAEKQNRNISDNEITEMLDFYYRIQKYEPIFSKYINDKFISEKVEKDINNYIAILDEIDSSKKIVDDINKNYDMFSEIKENDFTKMLDEKIAEYNASFEKVTKAQQNFINYEEPTKLWKKRATINLYWFAGSFVLVLGVSILLICLLTNTVLPFYNNLDYSKDSNIIKVTASLAAIFSALLFLMMNLFKVTFTFFNLYQDANERATLAKTFYSLSKDENIKEKEREIIIQALFARTESGLLKHQETILPSIMNQVNKNR